MRRSLALVGTLVGALGVLHCVHDDSGATIQGGLGNPCYPNATCLDNLVCSAGVCVASDGGVTVDGGDAGATPPSSDPTRVPNCPVDQSNRRVFVTSEAYPMAEFTNATPQKANAACQQLATAAGLAGTWRAWISDTDVDAVQGVLTPNVRYVTLDGQTVYENASQLDAGVATGIDVDERCLRTGPDGGPNAGREIWTGTDRDGRHVVNGTCQNWSNPGASVAVGLAGRSGPDWTFSSSAPCSVPRQLYCFEQ